MGEKFITSRKVNKVNYLMLKIVARLTRLATYIINLFLMRLTSMHAKKTNEEGGGIVTFVMRDRRESDVKSQN